MNLRQFIQLAEGRQWVTHIDHAMPPDEKLARELYGAGAGLLYVRSRWNGYRIVAGVCAARRNFAAAFDAPEAGLLARLVAALRSPAQPPLVERAACQEVVETDLRSA